MTDFQYHFQKLPCFNCKKTTVNTDLGWLTTTMKDDVMAQLATIIEQDNVEELADQVEDEDKQEVVNEVEELADDGKNVIVFEHEIALQSCTDCDIEEVSEQE